MSRKRSFDRQDPWVALLVRSAPWIVGALVAGIVVLWRLAAVLGSSWARF